MTLFDIIQPPCLRYVHVLELFYIQLESNLALILVSESTARKEPPV